MKKQLTILSLLLILVASCSKDVRTVRQFNGAWNIDTNVSFELDEFGDLVYESSETNAGTISFDKKTKEAIYSTVDGTSVSFTYEVSNKGTELILTSEDGTKNTFVISDYNRKESMTLTQEEETSNGGYSYLELNLSKN